MNFCLLYTSKEGKYATLRLPSGEMRLVPIVCRATIGVVGNGDPVSYTHLDVYKRQHPDGTREEISVEVAENELIYEVEDFITYVKNRENPLKLQGDQKEKKSDTEAAHEEELVDEDSLQVYEKISKDVMDVMDQVRKENGIIFPADKDPDVLKERLEQQLDFIREVDKVKLITRQTPLANGSRKENDCLLYTSRCV